MKLRRKELAMEAALKRMRAVKAGMSCWRDYAYLGIEDFLLHHGRWYKPRPLPKNEIPTLPKHCFAAALVFAATKGYKYIEGVALPHGIGLPLHHGWNLDAQGRLIDSTWEHCGDAYLGVEFSVGRAYHAQMDCDAAVLDNPTDRFDLYRHRWRGEDFKKEWPETAASLVEKFGLESLVAR